MKTYTASLSDALAWAKSAANGEYLAEYGSDEEISALRAEAGEAGDLEQVALCDAAVSGDAAARAKCRRALDANDSGSRCGYGGDELAQIESVLRARDLTIDADDRGLRAVEVSS